MTLKFQLDSLEGVEEPVAALSVEKEGKFVLGNYGLPQQEDVTGLKAKVEELLGEKRAAENGFGTDVEVGHAMVHGGPFPSTSDSWTTSVGSLAIARILRPVSYQDLPQELQPEALQDANPAGVPQRVDGQLKSA